MRAVLVCLGLLVAARGEAEPLGEGAALSLRDVVAAAVRQAPEMERARLDLASATAVAERVTGVRDVHLGAVTDFARSRDSPTSAVGSNRFQSADVGVSVSQTIGSGATIAVKGTTGVTTQQLVAYPDETRGYTSSLALSVTQPLLRGAGGIAAPIRQAAEARDAAALSREARARELLIAITAAYWQVALAWDQLEVRRASLALGEKQLEFTRGAIRSDKVAKSEELAVSEVIAVRQLDVIAGEQQVLDASLALRQLAGLEIGPDALAVRTEALPAVAAAELDQAAAVAAAFARSAELAGLEATERAGRAAVEAAENAARSRLDLAVSGGPQATASGLGASLANTGKVTGYQVSASLTYDHALGEHAERGGEAVARATLAKARTELAAAKARTAGRVTRAAQRARAALASLTLCDRAIELATANIEAEQHRFELAKSTNFEVLRRQDELQTARLRRASAVVDYLSARAEVEGLTGELLGRYGVVIQ